MIFDSITIQTGARLHFGPLSYRPETGRHFGGMGLMIQFPGFRIRVSASDLDELISCPERVQRLLNRIRTDRPDWNRPLRIVCESVIPTHQGLGSGTQLGMALAEAVGTMHGAREISVNELASLSGRGQRSSVGLHGYWSGGLLVDAGHAPNELISPLACRIDFPDEWGILLVTPPDAEGISGPSEKQAFEQLQPMCLNRTGQLCQLVLMEILPAIQCRDFVSFSQGLNAYGTQVGEYFETLQGGVFAHSGIAEMVDRLQLDKTCGVAQSSWGPTIAIFFANSDESSRIESLIGEDEFGKECRLTRTAVLNQGRLLQQNEPLKAMGN